MNKNFKHSVCFLCAIFLFELSVTITLAAPRPRYGGVLRHGIFQRSISFDPVDILNFAELQIGAAIFEGLVKYDADGRIVPAVASEWATPADGRTWTFIIANEAKFHSGKIVTASDVKLSIQRSVEKMSQKPGYLSSVDEITIIDEHTLRINLTKIEPDFLGWLMLPQAWIVPVDEVDKKSFGRRPIGTGPFKIAEQNPSEIKLIANAKYPWGRPFLDELIFKYYDSLQTARFNFESGGLDLLHIPVADAAAMEITRNPLYAESKQTGKPESRTEIYYTSHFSPVNIMGEKQGRQLLKKEIAELVYLQLNPRTFKNEQWQDALKYAIDVQSILNFQYGLAKMVYSRTGSRGDTVSQPHLKTRALYNPTKARRMLKSDSWQSDRKLNFIVANLSDNTGNAVAVRIQRMLSSIGMNTSILHLEQSEFKKAVRDENFDLALLSAPLLYGNIGYPSESALLLYQLPSYILRQSNIYGVNAMFGGGVQFENVWLKGKY